MQMSLIGSERRVQLPARKGRPEKLLRIPVSSNEPVTIGGSEPGASAAGILHRVENRLNAGAQSGEAQQWFRGDVEIAEEAVRKILATTKERALIIDPYFGADDAKPWLPTIAGNATEVQVLTSSSGLRQRGNRSSSLGARECELSQLEKLRDEIRALAEAGLVNATTIRVMMGAHPPIHDRFLVADDRVWLLGSSLNMFGLRGTMLVRLPSPLAVLPCLERVWSQESVSLDDAIAQLSSNSAEQRE